MEELGFIRYGELIRTNVKHLGLCCHVYLEGAVVCNWVWRTRSVLHRAS